MKTPEEIKKGQECCTPVSVGPRWKTCSEQCPYWGIDYCKVKLNCDTLCYIERLELYVSQVSEALCGKENATVCEVLDAVSQLKSRLSQVERERNAAVDDLLYLARNEEGNWACDLCNVSGPLQCTLCVNNMHNGFKWRGVCPGNTKEEEK